VLQALFTCLEANKRERERERERSSKQVDRRVSDPKEYYSLNQKEAKEIFQEQEEETRDTEEDAKRESV
jgi:hypothetical protein